MGGLNSGPIMNMVCSAFCISLRSDDALVHPHRCSHAWLCPSCCARPPCTLLHLHPCCIFSAHLDASTQSD
ncbi:hypothetical protein BRADI_3g25594v3 [Brachypodium distachyon]|uniref:Uncharacterized protein n=1 Tax=Brachypodium distachyon TaxID=15368 RepID=A0A2K2CZ90_BRADI|nr:hypothetical protein BRADI_3g25594v3 [Brachypodium distachyon]